MSCPIQASADPADLSLTGLILKDCAALVRLSPVTSVLDPRGEEAAGDSPPEDAPVTLYSISEDDPSLGVPGPFISCGQEGPETRGDPQPVRITAESEWGVTGALLGFIASGHLTSPDWSHCPPLGLLVVSAGLYKILICGQNVGESVSRLPVLRGVRYLVCPGAGVLSVLDGSFE